MRRTTTAAAAVVAGAVIGSGIAAAAIPNNNTHVFSACVAGNGSLRLIDQQAGRSCRAGERLVHWNQKGRPGPPGPAGQSLLYTAGSPDDPDFSETVKEGDGLQLVGANPPVGHYLWHIWVEGSNEDGMGALDCRFDWDAGGGRLIRTARDTFSFSPDQTTGAVFITVEVNVTPDDASQSLTCFARGADVTITQWQANAEPFAQTAPIPD
jgi:hypothetical protein